MDYWSKKGLTASYLGISACFFDPGSDKVCHATLDVKQIAHPHTGKSMAKIITECLKEWGLTKDKVTMIVSDNGANMVKAVKIMQEEAQAESMEEIQENDQGNENDMEL